MNEYPNKELLSKDRYRVIEIAEDGDDYKDITKEFIESDEEHARRVE